MTLDLINLESEVKQMLQHVSAHICSSTAQKVKFSVPVLGSLRIARTLRLRFGNTVSLLTFTGVLGWHSVHFAYFHHKW